MTNEENSFTVSAEDGEITAVGIVDGEVVVKGSSIPSRGRGLSQMEKLYEMWSTEAWRHMNDSRD